FSTAPYASGSSGVTRYHKHISAVTGNAAMSPDTAFSGRGRPGFDVGWIVNVHTYNPTMIASAIAEVSRVRHVHDPVYKSQRTSIFLHQRAEDVPVIHGCGVHIHGPACIRGAGVHIQ